MSRLERRTQGSLEERRRRLGAVAAHLEALSPLATLRRGYSVARTSDGRLLRSVEELPSGSRFELRVTDGVVAAESLGPVTRDLQR
jgi:exodeoxyribonuclease VII large subunit